MTKLRPFGVIPGVICYINDGGPDQGKLRMLGITGKSMTIAGHTTRVSLYFYVPATTTTPAGPIRVALAPDGTFLPVAPFVLRSPCRDGVVTVINAKLEVLHEFLSTSGGPTQRLIESVPVPISCPLSPCSRATASPAKSSVKKSSASKTVASKRSTPTPKKSAKSAKKSK